MTSTALGAETKKEEKRLFLSAMHMRNSTTRSWEGSPVSRTFYHKALCYCLGISLMILQKKKCLQNL